MTGFFTSAYAAMVRGAGPGLRQFARSYGTYRPIMLDGFLRPDTVDKAVATVRQDLSRLKAAGFDKGPPGQLRIATGFEFSRNGYIEDDEYRYDANTPIPAAFHQAMAETAMRELRTWQPGLIYTWGTSAIDTGVRDSQGNLMLENRGLAIASGADGDALDFSKATTSHVDFGPNYLGAIPPGLTMRSGDGPVPWTVKDVMGGRPVQVIFTICKDLERLSYPIEGQIIIGIGAGFPAPRPIGSVEYVINDALYNSFYERNGNSSVRIFTPATDDPRFKQVLRELLDAYPEASAFTAAFGMGAPAWEAIRDYLNPRTTMVGLPYERIPVGDGTFAITAEERPIPEIDDDAIQTVNAAVIADRATLLSNGLGRSALDAYADRIEASARDLPWDYVQEEIAREIGSATADAVRSIEDPFSTDPEALAARVADPAFVASVEARLSELVTEALDGVPDFAAVVAAIGAEAADSMASAVAAKPVFDRMTDARAGSSWLADTVLRAVLDLRTEDLESRRGDLQTALDEATDTATRLSSELSARQRDERDVEAALEKDPDDPDLQKRLDDLKQEIERLAGQDKDAADREEQARRDLDDADAAIDGSKERATEIGRAIDERAGEIFHGE